ncbi:S-layer homology domain-containing protein [Paenibacillus sonchi]
MASGNTDGRFNPAGIITRQEMIVTTDRALTAA